MSLADLLAALAAEAAAEIAGIEAEADRQLADLETAGRGEAAAAQAAAQEKQLAGLEQARQARLQQARLEALQIAGAAREQQINLLLDAVDQALADVRARPAYPRLLEQLLFEAAAQLDTPAISAGQAANNESGPKPVVLVDPRDRPLLDRFSHRFDLRSGRQSWGGVVVLDPDERIIVDNTLESRLARARPMLHQMLANRLDN